MPRKKRESSITGIYHVVIKGINSQLLFEKRQDYLKYLDILEYQKLQCDFKIYAYCLMSNHVHLLIQTTSTPLASIFRKINTTYSCWFNLKYQRSGPLLDGRYDFTDTSFALEQMGGISNFVGFHNASATDNCLDIHKIRKRMPDDVAISIIIEICNVKSPTAVAELHTIERNKCVRLCKEKGISARQLNRLTGIPRGIIDRILANRI